MIHGQKTTTFFSSNLTHFDWAGNEYMRVLWKLARQKFQKKNNFEIWVRTVRTIVFKKVTFGQYQVLST